MTTPLTWRKAMAAPLARDRAQKNTWDRARFYRIEGRDLPSVTTVLDIVAKPGLGPWYAQQERRWFEAAMLEVLAKPGARDPEFVLAAVVDAVSGLKAADRERQRAITIGSAAHAGIEWHLRTALGEDAGAPPVLPEAAAWAVESWKDWANTVALEPLAIERTVYCLDCGYAGTLDLYARVKGVLTVIDWKTGRAIYPEALLQNVAYRHAAAQGGMPAEQGLIVRLPRLLNDPAWEVIVECIRRGAERRRSIAAHGSGWNFTSYTHTCSIVLTPNLAWWQKLGSSIWIPAHVRTHNKGWITARVKHVPTPATLWLRPSTPPRRRPTRSGWATACIWRHATNIGQEPMTSLELLA